MAREDFILNVRTAASLIAPPRVETDSRYLNGPRMAGVFENAELWIAPGSVADFDPNEFSDVPTQVRDALKHEVESFLDVALKVRSDGPATKSQSRTGRRHLEKVIALVGEVVVVEWHKALETLFRDIEKWSQNQHWEVERETKRLTETMLGHYDVPRLLIHGSAGRCVIDPIARFAVGCDGVVEMSILPSYDSAKLVRRNHKWYVNPSGANAERQPLNEARFCRTFDRLLKAA